MSFSPVEAFLFSLLLFCLLFCTNCRGRQFSSSPLRSHVKWRHLVEPETLSWPASFKSDHVGMCSHYQEALPSTSHTLLAIFQGRRYCFHFIGEGTKAQRSQVICPRSWKQRGRAAAPPPFDVIPHFIPPPSHSVLHSGSSYRAEGSCKCSSCSCLLPGIWIHRAAQRLHDPHASRPQLWHHQVPVQQAIPHLSQNPKGRVSAGHVPPLWLCRPQISHGWEQQLAPRSHH